MANQDFYRFHLSFSGQLVENSVDAFDVANTILATSQILNELATIHFGDQAKQQIQFNINAFKKGSLSSEFIILAKDIGEAAAPLIPISGAMYQVGSDILKAYGVIVKIRKILKGKPPKTVKEVGGGNIEITASDNANITVNYNDFRSLQSKTIQKNLYKMSLPLIREDSLINSIEIKGEEVEKPFNITKEEASYFSPLEESQTLPGVKYKGVVTKIDTKALSGYLSLTSKRLPFSFSDTLPEDQFLMLVESLKRRIQIYLTGTVQMDFENNPVSMQVSKVDSDLKLL